MSSDRDDRFSNPTGRSVALFIDWDNFAIGLRQEMPERPADVGPILRWARRYGVLTICRAYGEWRDAAERLALYNAGVEVVYAPVLPLGGSVMARNGGGAKSLADTAMAVDVTELLALMPTLTTVILATSDKDLIPVLRFAQRRGLHAAVVGSDRTAGALRDLADEYVTYRQLLDAEGAPSTQSRPVAVPPMRYPRGVRPALPTPSGEDYGRRHGRGVTMPATSVGLAGASPGFVTPPAPGVRVRPATTPETEEVEEHTLTPASTLRRRRRGGRRRRGQEVGGTLDADTSAELSDDEEPESADVLASDLDEAEDVTATPTETTASEEVAVAEPEAEPEGEAEPEATLAAADVGEIAPEPAAPAPMEETPTATETRSAARVEREVARPEPPVRRAPVVLPGERIKRLASAAPPANEEQPPATPGSVSVTPAAPGAEEAIPASEAQDESPVSAASPSTTEAEGETTPDAETQPQGASEPEQASGARGRGRSRRRTGSSRSSKPAGEDAAEGQAEATRASASPEEAVSPETESGGGADGEVTTETAEAAESAEGSEADTDGKPARGRGRSRRRGSRSR